MPIGTTTTVKLAVIPLGMLAVAATLAVDGDFTSDKIAIAFGVIGGMATQLDAITRIKITRVWAVLFRSASELIFSGLAGFIVHAVMLGRVETLQIIWGTAGAIGAIGSIFVRAFGQKYLSQFRIFSHDNDNDNDEFVDD